MRVNDATSAHSARCQSCGRDVPAGEFCGACGAHLGTGSAHRHHAFAAHPGEHVLHPAVMSTLFPHLPHRHSTPFRVALFVATALLIVMSALGLTATAIAVACTAVPLLYLIYLYETEVYEDEPVLVIAATFVAGIILAIPWTLLTGPFVTSTVVLNDLSSASAGRDIVAGALIPLAGQALMLIGPVLLYRRKYLEAMDGFAFGAATALGFTLAANLVDLWPQLSQGIFSSSTASWDNTAAILARGLLLPFIAASMTGLIGGALWLHKGRTKSATAYSWTTNRTATLLAATVLWIFLGLVNVFVSQVIVDVALYLAAALVLLFAVRLSIHHMLLAEAVEVPIGPPSLCFHCHYQVPRMAFCPHCGVATLSMSKRGQGKLIRVFR